MGDGRNTLTRRFVAAGMWRTVLILVCLVTSGCRFRAMRELAISPELEADVQEEILIAAEEWFALVPEARVRVLVSDPKGRRGSIAPAKGTERRDPCKRGAYGTTLLDLDRAPRILLCMSALRARPEALRITILHELGHALGRNDSHLIGEGNVMKQWPEIDAQLSTRDRDYLLAKR